MMERRGADLMTLYNERGKLTDTGEIAQKDKEIDALTIR